MGPIRMGYPLAIEGAQQSIYRRIMSGHMALGHITVNMASDPIPLETPLGADREGADFDTVLLTQLAPAVPGGRQETGAPANNIVPFVRVNPPVPLSNPPAQPPINQAMRQRMPSGGQWYSINSQPVYIAPGDRLPQADANGQSAVPDLVRNIDATSSFNVNNKDRYLTDSGLSPEGLSTRSRRLEDRAFAANLSFIGERQMSPIMGAEAYESGKTTIAANNRASIAASRIDQIDLIIPADSGRAGFIQNIMRGNAASQLNYFRDSGLLRDGVGLNDMVAANGLQDLIGVENGRAVVKPAQALPPLLPPDPSANPEPANPDEPPQLPSLPEQPLLNPFPADARVEEAARRYGVSPHDVQAEMNRNPGMNPDTAAARLAGRILGAPTGTAQSGGTGGAGNGNDTAHGASSDDLTPEQRDYLEIEFLDYDITDPIEQQYIYDLVRSGRDPQEVIREYVDITLLPDSGGAYHLERMVDPTNRGSVNEFLQKLSESFADVDDFEMHGTDAQKAKIRELLDGAIANDEFADMRPRLENLRDSLFEMEQPFVEPWSENLTAEQRVELIDLFRGLGVPREYWQGLADQVRQGADPTTVALAFINRYLAGDLGEAGSVASDPSALIATPLQAIETYKASRSDAP